MDRIHSESFEQQLLKSAQQLAAYIEHSSEFHENLSNEALPYSLADLRIALQSFRWAWPLKLENLAGEKLNRRQPMLGGALFTSLDHPWPEDSQGLLQPIAQIDLTHANRISGRKLGEGLLQIWTNAFGTESQIRLLPIEHVRLAEVSPIPPELGHAENLEHAFATFTSNRGGVTWPHAMKVTGTKERTLTWSSLVREMLSEFVEKLTGNPAYLVSRFLRILPELSPQPTPHLFGNFREIQYTAIERPPCLLSLDSEGPFCWGDSGSAQVFFNSIRKVINVSGETRTPFFFEWSCV